jgi:hypothetical protein
MATVLVYVWSMMTLEGGEGGFARITHSHEKGYTYITNIICTFTFALFTFGL